MLLRARFTALAVAAVFLASAGPAFAEKKAKEYDPKDFDTPEKVEKLARKYWKPAALGKIRDQGFRRAAVVEFNVEYQTAYKKGGDGEVGLLDAGKLFGAGKKKYLFDEEFKKSFPRKLYEEFRNLLLAQGFEVKTLEEVTAREAFAKIKGREEDTRKKSGKHGKTAKYELYPVEGLLKFKEGFSIGANLKTEAEMMDGLGVDLSLRVTLTLSVHKKGRPVLSDGSVVHVAAGVRTTESAKGNLIYGIEKSGSVTAKKPMFYNLDVISEKDFKAFKGKHITIDSEKYRAGVLEMYPHFMSMAVTAFD